MTVDEAIKFCNKKHDYISTVVDAEPYLHIEMMLKELKELRSCVKSSAFKDGYNKAIDDVMKKAVEIQKEQITNLEKSGRGKGKQWAIYMNTFLSHIQVACKRLLEEKMKGEQNDSR